MSVDFIGLGVIGSNGLGRYTQSFGTLISAMVPPRQKCFSRIMQLVYRAAGTAHVITLMAPIGQTVTTQTQAAGDASLSLLADPGVSGNLLAASDYLAWENTDGTYSFDLIASLATLVATMTSVLPKAVSAGAKVWNFGIIGDTHPKTGVPHASLTGVASQTTTYGETTGGVFCSYGVYEPIIVQSANGTATGFLESLTYGHTLR